MITFTGTTTDTSLVITSVANTTGVVIGGNLSGAGIPDGATVVSFVVNTSVLMSDVATASATITVTHGLVDIKSRPLSLATASGRMNSTSVTLSGARPLSRAVASGVMSGRARIVSAEPLSYAVASGRMTGSLVSLFASPLSFTVGTGRMAGKTSSISARPTSLASASGKLGGNTKSVSARPFSYAIASATLTGASDIRGLSVCDVLDEILGMWGIFNRCSAPIFAKDAAVNIINASMQMVWNNADGRNYWTNQTLTLTFAADASSQALPDDIQNVVGPCRLQTTRRPLAPIGTIGELETFSDIYLEAGSATEPVAYHIERMNQTGNDPAKTVLHVVPSPSASTAFLLEVVKEAPRFNMGDLASCPIIPIPHLYAETLLLPVARYLSSAFHLFRKADQKETIDREYQQARISLGLADPLPGKSGDNIKEEVTK